MELPTQSGVYIVRNDNLWRPNVWKIGYSGNIRRRVGEHRATQVEYFLHDDYENLERILKDHFYVLFHNIDGDEYFIGDDDEIVEAFRDITLRFSTGEPQRPIDSREYTIERIVNHDPETMMYEVKWEYWPDENNTWEPYSKVCDTDVFREYMNNFHNSRDTNLRNYFDTNVCTHQRLQEIY